MAVWCQAVKALAALDDRHAEFLFELTNAPREGRLAHVAHLRCPREVLFAGERDEVLKLPDVHARLIVRSCDR